MYTVDDESVHVCYMSTLQWTRRIPPQSPCASYLLSCTAMIATNCHSQLPWIVAYEAMTTYSYDSNVEHTPILLHVTVSSYLRPL